MSADALRLSVHFGESLTGGRAPASDLLMGCFAEHGIAAAVLLRGIEGFGLDGRIPPARSTGASLLAMAVDSPQRIRDALEDVGRLVPRGLVTIERARLATGGDVAGASFSAGPGGAGTLTLFCGAGERARGRPAYREAVALVRRHGASGAIVLAGVDGMLHGRRERARLFAANRRTPMAVVAVGPVEPLQESLPQLHELFARPVVTLERVAQLKHGGRPLEPPPRPAATAGGSNPAPRQALRVYARRRAEVDGRPLSSELTRRLRAAGAAGATTVLGEWGYVGDEEPYGDRLGTVTSHRPTYTVSVDRPERVAAVWPLVDELTAEHGIVTLIPTST